MNKKTKLAYRLVFLAPKQYININIYGYSLKKKNWMIFIVQKAEAMSVQFE